MRINDGAIPHLRLPKHQPNLRAAEVLEASNAVLAVPVPHLSLLYSNSARAYSRCYCRTMRISQSRFDDLVHAMQLLSSGPRR